MTHKGNCLYTISRGEDPDQRSYVAAGHRPRSEQLEMGNIIEVSSRLRCSPTSHTSSPVYRGAVKDVLHHRRPHASSTAGHCCRGPHVSFVAIVDARKGRLFLIQKMQTNCKTLTRAWAAVVIIVPVLLGSTRGLTLWRGEPTLLFINDVMA